MPSTYGPEWEVNDRGVAFDLPDGSDETREIRERAVECVRSVKWVETDLERCLNIDLTRASMTVALRPERESGDLADHYDRRAEVTLDHDDFDREYITDAAEEAIDNQIPEVDGSEVEVHFIDSSGVRCEIAGVME